uniref:Reverse transcriptase domain-containing protein n=1 Tax=Lactuca sativa TaxID=4236 RepID=A0A9R1XMC2_LACSA|nr:hypothetical protein LSAT_V11C300109140 [Lactuca sativa]
MSAGVNHVVIDAWNQFMGYGTPDAYLAAKLRFLKELIKKWRKEEGKKETKVFSDTKNMVNELEKLAEFRPLTTMETMYLKQKAKIKWTVDGDENTKFFHGYINNKNMRNLLHGVMINSHWTTEVNEIKEVVFKFYERKFKEDHVSRPKLINSRIESPFSLEEVKAAIWQCKSEKAPGPNGYSFKFFKILWDIIKYDVMNCVRYLEELGSLSLPTNNKIISKILSTRMKTVIGGIINDLDSILAQMGFGNKWRMWIRGCLKSFRAPVIINDAPTKEFSISKGVRQGDHCNTRVSSLGIYIELIV